MTFYHILEAVPKKNTHGFLDDDISVVSYTEKVNAGKKKSLLLLYFVKDGWPGGGEETVCYKRRPGVPQAFLRGGGSPQAVFQQQGAPQGACRHQTERVRHLCFHQILMRTFQSAPAFTCVDRTIKIPDSAEGLGFQIRGFGPSVVHAVGRGMSYWGTAGQQLPPQSLGGGMRDSATGGPFSPLMLSMWLRWLFNDAAKTRNYVVISHFFPQRINSGVTTHKSVLVVSVIRKSSAGSSSPLLTRTHTLFSSSAINVGAR